MAEMTSRRLVLRWNGQFEQETYFSFTVCVCVQPKPSTAVTIAVSSRTLFDMAEERKVWEKEGLEKYVAYQQEHEEEPLKPGAAFPFVKVSHGSGQVYVLGCVGVCWGG